MGVRKPYIEDVPLISRPQLFFNEVFTRLRSGGSTLPEQQMSRESSERWQEAEPALGIEELGQATSLEERQKESESEK